MLWENVCYWTTYLNITLDIDAWTHSFKLWTIFVYIFHPVMANIAIHGSFLIQSAISLGIQLYGY